MEIYSLGPTFLRETVLDDYISAIWTERFLKAGDFQISMAPTPERKALLREGTFLAERDSDEIMIIQSQLVKDGILTVKGQTAETFFNERYLQTSVDTSVNDILMTGSAGSIITQIVNLVGITADGSVGVGGAANIIPNLVIGASGGGATMSKRIPFGPAYDSMAALAALGDVGMKIVIAHADEFNYQLAFKTYVGIDRTSAQLENDPVRFSSAQDSMGDINSISTIAGYKNVVYVKPPSWSSTTPPVSVTAPAMEGIAPGFNRRVMVVQADIDEDQVTGSVTLNSLMQQIGRDALANNNYVKIVDGEVVPQAQYQYGKNYNLGDFIELAGDEVASVQKAQITEYIRSKDATGERAYPTVSVVD